MLLQRRGSPRTRVCHLFNFVMPVYTRHLRAAASKKLYLLSRLGAQSSLLATTTNGVAFAVSQRQALSATARGFLSENVGL